MTPTYLRKIKSMLVSAGLFRGKMADKYGEPFSEHSKNLCHQRKFYFVHNPKCGGTSIKHALQMHDLDGADHRTPTNAVHPKTWESYFTFVVVRHPIERLRSAWRFHTSASYTGLYYETIPNLRSMAFDEYFYRMKELKYCISPQWCYTYHELSTKNIDYICKMETLAADFEHVASVLNLENSRLPTRNASEEKPGQDLLTKPSSFQTDVLEFYREDFERFGYDAQR